MRLSVYATPASVSDKDLKDQEVVVVDVLRATSSIITGLYNNCKEVIPGVDIEEVIKVSRNYEKDSYLLCGERNTQPIDGFDLSNSPKEYSRETVEGKSLLMTTTNGTKAIRKAVDAKEIIICSMINISVVTEYLLKAQEDVVFICAGTNGRFSLDDIVTVFRVSNS